MRTYKNFPYRLCLITDPAYLPDDHFQEKIIAALDGGVDMVQYRNLSGILEQKLAQAKVLRRITRERGAALIINTDLDMAKAVQAEGVQLGKRSASIPEARKRLGKDFLIGASVHDAEEIREAQAGGADFFLLSPVFPPGSKPEELSILGLEKFARLCASAFLPVFALGGITPKNTSRVLKSGAHGVAVISGILGAPSIQEAARKMREVMEELGQTSRSKIKEDK